MCNLKLLELVKSSMLLEYHISGRLTLVIMLNTYFSSIKLWFEPTVNIFYQLTKLTIIRAVLEFIHSNRPIYIWLCLYWNFKGINLNKVHLECLFKEKSKRFTLQWKSPPECCYCCYTQSSPPRLETWKSYYDVVQISRFSSLWGRKKTGWLGFELAPTTLPTQVIQDKKAELMLYQSASLQDLQLANQLFKRKHEL